MPLVRNTDAAVFLFFTIIKSSTALFAKEIYVQVVWKRSIGQGENK